MKSALFIFVAGSLSVLLAGTLQPNPQPDNPEPVPLQTAEGITLNSGLLIANYPKDTLFANLYFQDVADVLIAGVPHTIPGRTFMIGPAEWLAIDTTATDAATADYIRVNATAGITTVRIGGRERVYQN